MGKVVPLNDLPGNLVPVDDIPLSPVIKKDNMILDKFNSLSQNAKIGVGAAATLPSLYGAGSILKGLGKFTYGIPISKSANEAEALQAYRAGVSDIKPRSTVTSMLENSSVVSPGKVIARDPLRAIKGLSPLNMAGTESKIGVDALNKASNIFKKVITPAFKKADELGLRIGVDSIFDTAIQAAESNKKFDPVTKAGVKDAIEDMRTEYKANAGENISLQDLHNSKSNIQGFTSKKVLNNEISPSDLQNARGIVGNTMKDMLHNIMKEKFGIDSATKYRDYANLQSAADKGILDMTAQKLDQGAGSLLSSIVKKGTTPVFTNLGKLTFDIGKGLQFLPKTIVKAVKASPAFLKGVISKSPTLLKEFLKDLPAQEIASKFGETVADSRGLLQDNITADLKKGLEFVNRGKKIPFDNIARIITKGKNKEESLRLLQEEIVKLQSKKRPDKIPTGADLVGSIFK